MSEASASFLDGKVILHAGDCLAVLDRLPANSVDAVVTDPPYHFQTIVKRFGKPGSAEAQFGSDGVYKRAAAGFMGKNWDGGDIAFDPATWARVLRVLKPGGMLAAFSAPKCYHKMAFAIEAAGFETRDRVIHFYDLTERELAFLDSLSPAQLDALARIMDAGDPLGDLFWCFGSGFPKGLDVAKAIDAHLGARRDKVPMSADVPKYQRSIGNVRPYMSDPDHMIDGPEPATDEARAWDGWNVALKPAYEPIALARKPLEAGSVAAQVLATGTGAINIDACRVLSDDSTMRSNRAEMGYRGGNLASEYVTGSENGRWPANLTHDGSDVVMAGFPSEAGGSGPASGPTLRNGNTSIARGKFNGLPADAMPAFHGDSGSAARFFYTAKADADDRLGSGHPTVKPINLMRWLVKLVTPAGGLILDPFAGTGTTGEAAFREGFSAVLIEREAEYRADIDRRMTLILAGAGERRARAAKAKAVRRAVEPDHGPLFGSPGVTGGGDRSTATSPTRTGDRPDGTQAMNEAVE